MNKVNSSVYNLLESVQPYKNPNSYIVHLCELNNKYKHDSFSKQKRVNMGKSTIYSELKISNEIEKSDIIEEISDYKLKVENIDWVEFKFVDLDIDVLLFLKESLNQVQCFVDNLYITMT